MSDDFLDKELMKELGVDEEDLPSPASQAAPQVKRPAPPPVPGMTPRPASNPPASAQRASSSASPQRPGPASSPVKSPVPPAGVPVTDSELAADDLEKHGQMIVEELPVHLVAVMAKQALKLKDVLAFKMGEVINFRKTPTEPIDLVANGKLVAKAELVLVDGKVGARIVKLIK